MSESDLFNNRLQRLKKARAAKDFHKYDFLRSLATSRMSENISFIDRKFKKIIDIGGHLAEFGEHIPDNVDANAIIHTNSSYEMISGVSHNKQALVMDESLIAIKPDYADAALSCLNLHHVNDLVGSLIQVRNILQKDGLFMGVIFGPETLRELREVLEYVEINFKGGVSPRISPFPDIRDAGSVLMRAGFALPVLDSEIITLSYENIFDLMHDIRGMGETNILNSTNKKYVGKDFFKLAYELYKKRHSDQEGRITVSIELITMSGWKPSKSQQEPAKRGSGKISLGEAVSNVI